MTLSAALVWYTYENNMWVSLESPSFHNKDPTTTGYMNVTCLKVYPSSAEIDKVLPAINDDGIIMHDTT